VLSVSSRRPGSGSGLPAEARQIHHGRRGCRDAAFPALDGNTEPRDKEMGPTCSHPARSCRRRVSDGPTCSKSLQPVQKLGPRGMSPPCFHFFVCCWLCVRRMTRRTPSTAVASMASPSPISLAGAGRVPSLGRRLFSRCCHDEGRRVEPLRSRHISSSCRQRANSWLPLCAMAAPFLPSPTAG